MLLTPSRPGIDGLFSRKTGLVACSLSFPFAAASPELEAALLELVPGGVLDAKDDLARGPVT